MMKFWIVQTLVGVTTILFSTTSCDGVKKRDPTPRTPISGVCATNPCKETNKSVCEEVTKGSSYVCICNKGYAELADGSCKVASTTLKTEDLVGTWKETKVIVISTGCEGLDSEKAELSSSYLQKISSSTIKIFLCKDKECQEKYDGEDYLLENGIVKITNSFETDLSHEYDTACKMILDLEGESLFLDKNNGYNYFKTTFRLAGAECKELKKQYPEIDASENCVTKWKSVTAKVN